MQLQCIPLYTIIKAAGDVYDINNDDINYNIVFNSIICKNAQDVCSSDVCSNEVCNFLNYGSVRNEKFKDAKICTNYREWRKCPKHDHLPTNNI